MLTTSMLPVADTSSPPLVRVLFVQGTLACEYTGWQLPLLFALALLALVPVLLLPIASRWSVSKALAPVAPPTVSAPSEHARSSVLRSMSSGSDGGGSTPPSRTAGDDNAVASDNRWRSSGNARSVSSRSSSGGGADPALTSPVSPQSKAGSPSSLGVSTTGGSARCSDVRRGTRRALSGAYQPHLHWWESVLMVQRLALALVFAFGASDPGVQVSRGTDRPAGRFPTCLGSLHSH